MADPTVFVQPPRRETRRGGLKSLIDFVPTQRLGAAAGINYISEGCSFPSDAPGLCWGTVITGDKEFDGIAVENGITSNFAQYVGVECFIGPDAEADYARRARALLEATESHEIEAVLHTWADLTPDTLDADNITAAIGAAEEYADQYYVGRPVIILSRNLAVQAKAAGAIDHDREGNKWTANGTPVIASWTFPDDAVYTIGFPTVYASDIEVINSRDLGTNREMAIAERVYGVAVDCEFRHKVNVGAP